MVVLLTVLLMTPVTGALAQPRIPTAACNPGRSSDFPLNRWAGWQVGQGQVIGGVYAKILNAAPYVDPRDGSDFVYAWTMLTGDDPVGADAPYVQIGWVQFANGERHTMEQWKKVGEPPGTHSCPAPRFMSTISTAGMTVDTSVTPTRPVAVT